MLRNDSFDEVLLLLTRMTDSQIINNDLGKSCLFSGFDAEGPDDDWEGS